MPTGGHFNLGSGVHFTSPTGYADPTEKAAAVYPARHAPADECVAVITPEPFHAVGLWYEDFSQVTDQDVCALLDRADGRPAVATPD